MAEAEGERRREEMLVEEEDEGQRLDVYLAGRLALSRTRIAELIKDHQVLLNGAPAKKSEPVAAGQKVQVTVPRPEPLDVEPQDLPLDVVHEDSSLLVVNKVAGMVVHPGPGHPDGTLVNALLHHVDDLAGIGGALRPGIVHRLDKDTSGLLVVAKTDRAHRGLSKALQRREVRRIYLGASWGHLAASPTTIHAPIGRDPGNRKRMAVVEGGRKALTRVRVRERWAAAELLDVALKTGRTHQIRVHLAHLGHPIVSDPVYGKGWERGMGGRVRPWAREFARRVPRLFLHARELAFRHPETGEPMRFRSPLPPDLAGAVAWAREKAGHEEAPPGGLPGAEAPS